MFAAIAKCSPCVTSGLSRRPTSAFGSSGGSDPSSVSVSAVTAAATPGALTVIGFDAAGGIPAGGAGGTLGLRFGPGDASAVEELGAWLALDGVDANGAAPGVAARLGADPLPAGLVHDFAWSASATDITLSYTIENRGAAVSPAARLLAFVDAEIAEATTTFFNEWAETSGTPAPGQGWEIDEPGYAFGDVRAHLAAGLLDGTNALAGVAAADDVAIALSFELGALAPGQRVTVDVMLSEAGAALGPFRIVQRDTLDPFAPTVSGAVREATTPSAPIPERAGAALFALGLGVAARRVGGRSAAPFALARPRRLR